MALFALKRQHLIEKLGKQKKLNAVTLALFLNPDLDSLRLADPDCSSWITNSVLHLIAHRSRRLQDFEIHNKKITAAGFSEFVLSLHTDSLHRVNVKHCIKLNDACFIDLFSHHRSIRELNLSDIVVRISHPCGKIGSYVLTPNK